MQTLFSSQKSLYSQALLQATGHELVRTVLLQTIPQLNTSHIESITIFLKKTTLGFSLSLCSQNTTLLTLLKLNTHALQEEITKLYIDKNLLTANYSITLSIYRR